MTNDKTIKGIIIKGVGGLYFVESNGLHYQCKASGRLRIGQKSPTVGDFCHVEIDDQSGEGYITQIDDRKNLFIRPQIANIDRLFILASSAPPQTDLHLVDKMTVIALWQNVEPVIVLNKCDIDSSDNIFDLYSSIGFKTVRTSAVTGDGLDELMALLAGKVSAFTGNSGIGKSSLLNRIDSRFQLSVGEISQKIGRGKNTTRHVELMPLKNGGYVADTPGFSSFDIAKMEYIPKEMLPGLFPEIEEIFGQCRFSDCAHIKEPGCAFLQKIAEHPRLKSRHQSYVKLYEELSQINEWEL